MVNVQALSDREVVDLAASFVDRLWPGWDGRVNLDAFHLDAPDCCVLAYAADFAGVCWPGPLYLIAHRRVYKLAAGALPCGVFFFSNYQPHWRDLIHERQIGRKIAAESIAAAEALEAFA